MQHIDSGCLVCHRGARCQDQEDREGGHSDHDQREGGGRVQRGGADRRGQKMTEK